MAASRTPSKTGTATSTDVENVPAPTPPAPKGSANGDGAQESSDFLGALMELPGDGKRTRAGEWNDMLNDYLANPRLMVAPEGVTEENGYKTRRGDDIGATLMRNRLMAAASKAGYRLIWKLVPTPAPEQFKGLNGRYVWALEKTKDKS